MPVRPWWLSIPTLAAILVLAAPCPAGTGPAFLSSDLPGADLASNILFETTFPINELLPDVWTREQQQEILYFRERMKKDDRIFLIVQATVDPIGTGAENAQWGKAISLAVADRLRESGIRADRILLYDFATSTERVLLSSGGGESWTDAGWMDSSSLVVGGRSSGRVPGTTAPTLTVLDLGRNLARLYRGPSTPAP